MQLARSLQFENSNSKQRGEDSILEAALKRKTWSHSSPVHNLEGSSVTTIFDLIAISNETEHSESEVSVSE